MMYFNAIYACLAVDEATIEMSSSLNGSALISHYFTHTAYAHTHTLTHQNKSQLETNAKNSHTQSNFFFFFACDVINQLIELTLWPIRTNIQKLLNLEKRERIEKIRSAEIYRCQYNRISKCNIYFVAKARQYVV